MAASIFSCPANILAQALVNGVISNRNGSPPSMRCIPLGWPFSLVFKVYKSFWNFQSPVSTSILLHLAFQTKSFIFFSISPSKQKTSYLYPFPLPNKNLHILFHLFFHIKNFIFFPISSSNQKTSYLGRSSPKKQQQHQKPTIKTLTG